MQSVKSNLQSIFHQYDDIQELFFRGEVSSFDINACDSHGKTLLHHACEYGLTEGVKILLANNAQVDVCDEKSYTPLHCACQNNHIRYDICKILIHGAPSISLHCSGMSTIVSARDKHYNRTILHYACIHGDFDVTRSLLKVSADPCAQDKLGNNPMHYACENGHLWCVRQLIATSQHPNGLLQIPNNDGVTPLAIKTHSGGTILHIACENHDVYVAAKLLEAGADSNLTDVFGFTPLMRAVTPSRFYTSYTNSTAIITTLCKSNCNVNAMLVLCKSCSSGFNIQYSEGSTALHIATDNDRIAFLVINALIHNGAALDARDVHGRTPLHIASMRGHHHLIKLLAPSPESFHFKDNDGCTPLHYACKNSHLEFIRRLTVQIPDVIDNDDVCDLMNVDNNDGTTPLSVRTGSGGTILHVACDKGDIKLVKKLLEAGADPNVTDKFGITPLSVRTGSGGTILHVACDKGDINLVKKLLEAGADPNVPDEFGFTPLMRAVVSTSSKSGITTDVFHSIITALCNSKCNVNAAFVPSSPSDSNVHYCEGSTVLHVAIDRWKVDRLCVQALVDNGAALYARNVHGHTPFHIASMRGHHHLIKLLAPSPKSFHFKDNDGCTPVYYACKNSHVEFIRNLIVQSPDVVIGYLMKLANNDGTTPLSVRTGSGGTILHVACDKGDINLVKKLLEAGADPNVPDEFGFTPLMRAVVSTSSKSGITTDVVHSIITALCNSKCNVNAAFVPSSPSDSNVHYCEGSTVLHVAIDRWKVDRLCVQALVDNGAALYARNVHGHTPFHIASMRGHHHLIKLLAPSPKSFHFKDNDGCTPVYYACKNSHVEFIRNLIVQSPDVVIGYLMKLANNDGTTPLSVRTGSGGTILHVACDKGDINLVKKLLEAGADPNVPDEFGFTPLMRAVVSTSSKSGITTDVVHSIITALCNSKCNVNAAFVPSSPSDSNVHYCEGSTVLHVAIDRWKVDRLCVQALVDNGAALYARNVHGHTPFHIASMRGHHHLIKLLAPSPKSFHFKDNDGCTPVYYACKNSHVEFIRNLIVQIPDVVIGYLMKLANNDGTTPLSVRTGRGGTILHVACDKGDINLVKKLLEAGADPNVTDKFGITPLSVRTGSGGTILHVACDKGDINLVNKLLEAGADPNVTDKFGITPLSVRTSSGGTILHVACDKGDIKLVKKLLEAGADPNVTDKLGITPLSVRTDSGGTILHVACNKGDIKIVKKLLEAGADPNITDKLGITPLSVRTGSGRTILHVACDKGDFKLVKKLLEAGADPNVTDKLGITPLSVRTGSGGTILHVACDKGDINLVKKLLEAGADPNVPDEFGFTPLMRAVVSTSSKSGITTDVVHSIITALCNSKCNLNAAFVPSSPSDSNVHYCEGSTVLHMAIDRWKVDRLCVQALVDNGAALYARNVHGHTPFHIASMRGHHHLIKLLAPSSKSFHFKDNDGCTPVYYACKNSHVEFIRNLIVQIPDVVIGYLMKLANNDGTTPLSVRTGRGGTILHVACDKGDINLVKKLLEAGADPNVTDKFGITPLSVRTGSGGTILHVACDKGDINLVNKLLEAGADPNVTDKFGITPLSVRTSSGGTILHVACDKGDIKLVKKLLEAGADPNVTDKLGITPLSVRTDSGGTILHVACNKGDIKIVKKLLEAGADPNITDKLGITPLSVRTGSGRTILHVACDKEDIKLVKKLLEAGADPNVTDKLGITPLSVRTDSGGTILHVACNKGDVKLIKKLLEAGADPNVTDKFGFTPLMRAVVSTSMSGITTGKSVYVHFSIIAALCNSKCSVNAIFVPSKPSDSNAHYCEGSSALHMAIYCWTHDRLYIKLLVDNGAALDARDVHGHTPLHIACMLGHYSLIKLLARTPESFHLRDNDGCTPVYYACKNSH